MEKCRGMTNKNVFNNQIEKKYLNKKMSESQTGAGNQKNLKF